MFFFFKQKTAYEMRISDWSSDVCSSDLQDREDVAAEREAWLVAQPHLDPQRLVFIDETGTSTKMARMYGRALRGERCRAPVPHGHWKTTTFVGALRLGGVTAPMTTDGAMHKVAFLAYVEQVLEIGRAAWRERVYQYVEIWLVDE